MGCNAKTTQPEGTASSAAIEYAIAQNLFADTQGCRIGCRIGMMPDEASDMQAHGAFFPLSAIDLKPSTTAGTRPRGRKITTRMSSNP